MEQNEIVERDCRSIGSGQLVLISVSMKFRASEWGSYLEDLQPIENSKSRDSNAEMATLA